jgi:hypothetical protein
MWREYPVNKGDLVKYYDEGWRYGYVDSITDSGDVKIRPMPAYKGPEKLRVVIDADNVEEIERS